MSREWTETLRKTGHHTWPNGKTSTPTIGWRSRERSRHGRDQQRKLREISLEMNERNRSCELDRSKTVQSVPRDSCTQSANVERGNNGYRRSSRNRTELEDQNIEVISGLRKGTEDTQNFN